MAGTDDEGAPCEVLVAGLAAAGPAGPPARALAVAASCVLAASAGAELPPPAALAAEEPETAAGPAVDCGALRCREWTFWRFGAEVQVVAAGLFDRSADEDAVAVGEAAGVAADLLG